MISFSAYREKAIAIREERLGRKYNPEKRADDKAFEHVIYSRYARIVGVKKKDNSLSK